MKNILLNIVALIVGIVVGSCVNMALVAIGPNIIPPPAGADMTTSEGLAKAMPLLEAKHFIFPFLAHALGTFSGALSTYLIAASRRRLLAWVIGFFFLAGGIAASFMIPAPASFIALDLVCAYLPMAWLATQLGCRWRPENMSLAAS